MRINEQQAGKLQSLSGVLREQALFQQVREDNADYLVQYLAKLGSTSPQEMGTVSPTLMDILASVALSEKSWTCLAHILPRLPRADLHGATLGRVVEKDNAEGFQCIQEFAPLSDQQRLEMVERAVFNNSPKVLEKLLLLGPLRYECANLYDQAVARARPGLACLRVLMAHHPSQEGYENAMLEALSRANVECIDLMLPHVDVVQMIHRLCKQQPYWSDAVCATLDEFIVKHVAEDRLEEVASSLALVTSAPDKMPGAHARLAARQLQQDTSAATRPAPSNRL